MEYNTETEIRLCVIQIFDPSPNKKNNPIGPVVCTKKNKITSFVRGLLTDATQVV